MPLARRRSALPLLVGAAVLAGLWCRPQPEPDPLLDALAETTGKRAWRAVRDGQATPCELVARPEQHRGGLAAVAALGDAGWGWRLQDDFEAEPAGADWSAQGVRHGGRPGSAPWLTRWHGCDGECSSDAPREGVWIGEEPGEDGLTQVLMQRPTAPEGDGITRSSLVEADRGASDFFLTVRRRTLQSLRPAPNNWETAWVFFRYRRGEDLAAPCGGQRSLYLALHRGEGTDAGWEFGRFDPEFAGDALPGAGRGCQQFLATGDAVRDTGDWASICVAAVGDHVAAWIDGQRLRWLGSPTLTEPGRRLGIERGSIALYNEDAAVAFDDVGLFGTP